MSKRKRTDEDHFNAGVLCALAVVRASGDDVVYDEIVTSVGDVDGLYRCAKRDGNVTWTGIGKARSRIRAAERRAREWKARSSSGEPPTTAQEK